MEITTTLRPNGVAVIKPAGHIDINNASEFKQRVGTTIDSGYPWLVIDCSAITFLDSSGLGALVTSLKQTHARGGDLRLAQVPQNVRMILELTSLQSYLPRYASITDAVATYP